MLADLAHRTATLMVDDLDALAWLREHAPTLWSILNSRAQADLPRGLREYLAGTLREMETGRVFLMAAEKHFSQLAAHCGLSEVQHTYRRDLSAVRDEQRLAELLC